MRDHATDAGLELRERGTDAQATYQRLRALLASGAVELPPVPQLRTDLLAVRAQGDGGQRADRATEDRGREALRPRAALATAVERASAGAREVKSEAEAYARTMQARRSSYSAPQPQQQQQQQPDRVIQRDQLGAHEMIDHRARRARGKAPSPVQRHVQRTDHARSAEHARCDPARNFLSARLPFPADRA